MSRKRTRRARSTSPKPNPEMIAEFAWSCRRSNARMPSVTGWCMYSVYSNARDMSENSSVGSKKGAGFT